MSSPASSATSSTPQGAQSYIPQGQPQADQAYQNLVRSLMAQYTGPAGQGVRNLTTNYLTGTGSALPVGADRALQGARQGANYFDKQFASLGPDVGTEQTAARQILNESMNPQSAVYQQGLTQAGQAANVANAAGGLSGTPYGASVLSNAINNYNLGWQQNLLNRQTTGAGAAAGLQGNAANLASTLASGRASTAALPYQTGSGVAQNAISGQNANLASASPVLNALQSYLGLGQSASSLAGQLGQQGFNQLAEGIGGGIGALGGINSLTGGGITSGLGSLFGGGGADVASTLGATASGPFSAASSLPAAASLGLS